MQVVEPVRDCLNPAGQWLPANAQCSQQNRRIRLKHSDPHKGSQAMPKQVHSGSTQNGDESTRRNTKGRFARAHSTLEY